MGKKKILSYGIFFYQTICYDRSRRDAVARKTRQREE